MIKAGIIGHFGFGNELLNGQTIKTKNVAKALAENIGDDQILKIDTHGGLKALLKLPFQISSCLKKVENVIIMPANRGLQIITPLLLRRNRKKKRKIHYVVIGGWLPSLCLKKPKLAEKIKKFDYVYVETSTMKKALEEQGFANVVVMPNFKDIVPIDESQLSYQHSEPFSVCTFSRVMKEKGIEDIIKAVRKINSESEKIVYKLDIYGQVDFSQSEWFNSLRAGFPSFIQYKGAISSNKSVEIVKNYFALIFPTNFYTEGIPGTILDAYASGVPVVASKWESFSDLIDDGYTGIGYEFNNFNQLVSILATAAQRPNLFNELKINCIKKSKEYLSSNVIKTLLARF